MRYIPLANSTLLALVDGADYEKVVGYRWRLHSHGYAVCELGSSRKGNRQVVYMHRLILPDSDEVDHRHGNRLDNRRSELRAATHGNNRTNTPKKLGCSSRFKGVYWNKVCGKWQAQLGFIRDGKKVGRYLGLFLDEAQAAAAYNSAAKNVFGEFALLNQV